MNTILVIGANNYIAAKLISKLENNIIGTVHSKNNINDQLKCKLYEFDLNGKIPDIKEDIDIIVHFASMTNINSINQDPIAAFNVNCAGLLKVLEFAKLKKIKKFIYISTGSVYGRDNYKAKEDNSLFPLDFYAVTKSIAEQLVKSYSNHFPFAIIRYFHVYGPGQKDRLIPRLIENIKIGKDIFLYNSGRNPKLSPIFIDDALELTQEIIDSDHHGIFNICGDQIVSINEICDIISKKLNTKPKYSFVEDSNAGDNFGDNSKVKELFKYHKFVDLNTGIDCTINNGKK